MTNNNLIKFENNQILVCRILFHVLTPPLSDFVKQNLSKKSIDWNNKLKKRLNSDNFNGDVPKWNDPLVLFKIIDYCWDTFCIESGFDRTERSIVNELREVRNFFSHNEIHRFNYDFTYRALHSTELLLIAINKLEEAEKVKQQRKELIEPNYTQLSELTKKSIEAEIDWRIVSRNVLEAQKFDRLTSNSLTAIDGIELERDEVYVPLGIVERKQRQKRDCNEGEPERGSELYQEKLIPIENKQFFEQIASKNKPIAIIGEPGAGKTTLLQQIASWILKEDTDSTPIWLSLSEMGTKSLRDYLSEDWLRNATQKFVVSSELKEAFGKLIESGKVWLLLDGVDEMAVDNPLQHITSQLSEGWINNVRVVLTCRLNVWDANKNALYDFDVYRNLDFASEQVDEFIGKWFEKSDTQKGKNLRSLLKQPGKERINDLIKNPLRLMLLCYSWQQQNSLSQERLPTTKAELYQRFVSSFYNWNQGKVRERFSQTELNVALGQLALQAIDRNESRFRLRETFISQYLEESLFEVAQNLGWLNQVGVAAENPTEKVYAFYHPTFEEYFAASAIDNWHFFLDHVPTNPSQGKYRYLEPQWQEVMLLWFGRKNISVDKKDKLIKALMEFSNLCFQLYGKYNYYSAKTYFVMSAIAAEFKENKFNIKIFEKIIGWVYGYFDGETEDWVEAPRNLIKLAEQALKQADRNIVLEALLNTVYWWEIDNCKERKVSFKHFWYLNELAPKHEVVTEHLIHWIDNVFIWKKLVEIDCEFDIHEPPNFSEEYFPFFKIKVGNSEIIKAIIRFLNVGYDGIVKLRNYRKYKISKETEQLPSLEEMPLYVEDELGQKCLNSERWKIALEQSVIREETLEEKNLKRQFGLDEKLEKAAESFDAAGDTLARVAISNSEVTRLLIDILEKELSFNFKEKLYIKIINWLNIISSKNIEAIQLLSNYISNSNDWLLKYEAAKALKRLDSKNTIVCRTLDKALYNLSDEKIKTEVATELIEVNSKHYQSLEILFDFLRHTSFNSRFERENIPRILTNLSKIAVTNNSILERLIKLVKKNCNQDICSEVIQKISENVAFEKIYENLVILLNEDLNKSVRKTIALTLIDNISSCIDRLPNCNKVLDDLYNYPDTLIRCRAALKILELDSRNIQVLQFLLDSWVQAKNATHGTVVEPDKLEENLLKNSKITESLIEILQNLKYESNFDTELSKNNFTSILSLLAQSGYQTYNEEAIAVLTELLENTNNLNLCFDIACTLGCISPNNSKAVNLLIGILENNSSLEIRKSFIIRKLGLISIANQAVVDVLLKMIVEQNEKLTHTIVNSLIKNIAEPQSYQTVFILKEYSSIEKENAKLDKIFWHCAQTMSYPEFHRAWHNSQIPSHQEMSEFEGVGANSYILALNLENLPLELLSSIDKDDIFKDRIQLICINQRQISDRNNPAVEIYDQMLDWKCPLRDNGEPETMPLLKSYWHSLQRNTDKLIVLVFYDSTALETEWTGFSQSILDPLNTFEGAICVITDQPTSKLKQFSPSSPNLIENLMGWMRKVHLES
ncbi:NACHT domain-containing NTPase [Myxosarcina sp. GI1]|uniref:NACHT domain-containing protein n=1 Tax=Myxosarcina sp. GI1 TaxID=1541065 RepID=UPI000689AB46|nr:Swt1 family HEPN domain-containing protein [Myxosarcina sp. GI1]